MARKKSLRDLPYNLQRVTAILSRYTGVTVHSQGVAQMIYDVNTVHTTVFSVNLQGLYLVAQKDGNGESAIHLQYRRLGESPYRNVSSR